MSSQRARRCGGSRPLLLLALLLAPLPSRAGVIALAPEAALEMEAQDGRAVLRGHYALQNQGDETAHDVFLAFEIGRSSFATGRADLAPGTGLRWDVVHSLAVDELACGDAPGDLCAGEALPTRGVFPVRVTRHFRDANAHPFTAVSVHALAIGPLDAAEREALEAPALRPTLHIAGVSELGVRARLAVENPSDQARRASVGLVLPQEYTSPATPFALELAPGAVAEAQVVLSNHAALTGSLHEVVAVVQWDERGVRRTATAVAIVPATQPDLSGTFLGALAASGGLALALLLVPLLRPAPSPGGPRDG